MTSNYYIDTRGYTQKPVTFTEAVIDGLAEGGGLYVPQNIPQLSLDDIVALADMPYAQRAAHIYQLFDVDLPSETVEALMKEAYGSNFDTPEICPITSLDKNTHVLELWHGPTSAFKDMALQCLPRFFSASARQMKEAGQLDHDFFILVATSGDTGKGALEGFRDVEGVSIGVLYPDGGVSDIQFKQMATQLGNNVQVWGVRGNFDDCQSTAKAVFGDESFAELLQSEHRIALSSANSINWGRLLPQVVYYISAYASLVANGSLQPGNLLDICVPTGNFGNILAAYYAKSMGVPLDRLMCASNENRVLADFINTGEYDISNREFVLTPSPSMDILVSSNLERQLFELTGRDTAAIKEWMNDLKNNKCFKVDRTTFEKLREHFLADSVNNEECLEVIRRVFNQHHYLIDPHTAVAYQVAENLRGEHPVLIASTAHWAKFGNNVYRALHDISANQPLPDNVAALTGCELNKLIAHETGVDTIPQGLSNLDELPIRFSEVIDAGSESVKKAIQTFLANNA